MPWRRGFRARPPPGEPDDDPRHAALPPDARPRGGPLHDVPVRLLPHRHDTIVPGPHRYGCAPTAPHGSTLRAPVKHPEAASDEAAPGLEAPDAVPARRESQPGHMARLPDPVR